jgi:hypothetical protein
MLNCVTIQGISLADAWKQNSEGGHMTRHPEDGVLPMGFWRCLRRHACAALYVVTGSVALLPGIGLAQSIRNTGASNVMARLAVLTGRVMREPPPVAVDVYWGLVDGGTNVEGWTNSVRLQNLQTSAFSVPISGLAPGTEYFYRCCANGGWASSSANFTTLALPTLVERALESAMLATSNSMTSPPTAYPRWWSGGSIVEALSSSGTIPGACPDILRDASGVLTEAGLAIPQNLLGGAEDAVRTCMWKYIPDDVGTNATRTNRIAYLIVNIGGELDANYMGGTNRLWSQSLREIDIRKVPGVTNTNMFFADRASDGEYRSLGELLSRNRGLNSNDVVNLSVCSHDPGRDLCFADKDTKKARLGVANTNDLSLKLNINAITNMDPNNYLGSPGFYEYTNRLSRLIDSAKISRKPSDIVWNIINWIDEDRYPQTDMESGRPAYVSTQGVEAMPLINEFALLPSITAVVVPIPGRPGSYTTNYTTNCQACVELWYPFVVHHETWTSNGTARYSLDFNVSGNTMRFDIPPMAYHTPSEFMVLTSSVITGMSADVSALVCEGSITDTYPTRRPVDAGPDRNGTNVVSMRLDLQTNRCAEVDDPRCNGKGTYWVRGLGSNTLGRMNSIADPWGEKIGERGVRQGLPIFVKNGPMENIGELGYIFLSNRENLLDYLGNPYPPIQHFWCTIDLLSSDQGAYLLDYVTVSATNRCGRGMVACNTRDPDTFRALFTEMTIGWTNQAYPDRFLKPLHVEDPEVYNLIENLKEKFIERSLDPARDRGFISFDDLFDTFANRGGDLAADFRRIGDWWSAQVGEKSNDKVCEDAFRQIVEMLSFRQNIFLIPVVAQSLLPDGTVEAEDRILATVYRDSYTGAMTLHAWQLLSETFRLSAEAGPHGRVSPIATNVPAGGNASFAIVPDSYYHIETIATNDRPLGSNFGSQAYAYVWSNVTSTGTLVTTFAASLGTNYGTPYAWLAEYGATGDLDSAETAIGSNGIPLWASYVADLNPTDANSSFSISDLLLDSINGVSVRFNSSTGRQYSLHYCVSAEPTSMWMGVAGQSNVQGRGAAMTLGDTNSRGPRFYRLQVGVPQ